METTWLNYLKRIHSLSTNGLAFSDNDYERERYEEIQLLANKMLADLGQTKIDAIQSLLSHAEGGYQTPKVEVRAAVIKHDKILLVQEKTDKRWALPGGYADIGLSPAENAVKEVWEEAGIQVKPIKLYALRHKAKGEYRPDVRDFYKIYFLCEQLCEADVKAGSEAQDAAYFSMQTLPELSTGRVVESDLVAAFEHQQDHLKSVMFDAI